MDSWTGENFPFMWSQTDRFQAVGLEKGLLDSLGRASDSRMPVRTCDLWSRPGTSTMPSPRPASTWRRANHLQKSPFPTLLLGQLHPWALKRGGRGFGKTIQVDLNLIIATSNSLPFLLEQGS